MYTIYTLKCIYKYNHSYMLKFKMHKLPIKNNSKHAYIYIYIYIYIHTHIHTIINVHAYKLKYIHTNAHAYIHIHYHIYTNSYMCLLGVSICSFDFIQIIEKVRNFHLHWPIQGCFVLTDNWALLWPLSVFF